MPHLPDTSKICMIDIKMLSMCIRIGIPYDPTKKAWGFYFGQKNAS